MLPPFSWHLFLFFTGYISGVLLSNYVHINPTVIIIFFIIVFVCSLFLINRKILPLLLFFLFTSIGFLRYGFLQSSNEILREFLPSDALEIKGEIISIPERRDNKIEFKLRLIEIKNIPVDIPLTLVVYSNYENKLEPGEIVILSGNFKKLRSRIIFEVKNSQIVKKSFSLKRYIYRLKRTVRRAIVSLYGENYSEFIQTIIIGERGKDIENIRYKFQKIGLAHILAISGLHVGLVLFFFHFLFKNLHFYGRKRTVLITIIMFSYMLLTGAHPPVVRATIMAFIYSFFWFFYFKPNPFNVLILSALLILVFTPEAIFQASFLLSFSAISGIFIIFYTFPEKNYYTLKAKIINYIKVALGSWIFIFPLIWYYWRILPLYTLIANVILLPLFSLIIACAFSAVLFSFFSFTVAKFFAFASYPLIYLLFKSSDFFLQLPHCYFKMPPLSIKLLILIYAILILTIIGIRDIIKRVGKRNIQEVSNV